MFASLLSTTLAFLVCTASARTVFTGGNIDGFPIITSLDITDVPSNNITRYWFYAGTQFGSIPLYLPVMVARGTSGSLMTGRKLSLSASIHGDELNGVPVVQRVFANATFQAAVRSGRFNGTVIGMPTMNPNGNQHSQRLFYSGNSNGRYSDLNRLFPGSRGSLASTYVYNIWNGVWGNTSNVDVAIDMHTVSTSSSGPLWAYADYRFPGVQRIAELTQADFIKIDPGDAGTVETTFIDNGVPAITLEIGTPKLWQPELIDRAEAFIYKVMDDFRMSPNASIPSVNLTNTTRWNNFTGTSATRTGWVVPTVELLDMVMENQTIATVYNSWGDVIEVLNATADGQVTSVRIDPIVEQGTSVITIAYNATAE